MSAINFESLPSESLRPGVSMTRILIPSLLPNRYPYKNEVVEVQEFAFGDTSKGGLNFESSEKSDSIYS